MGRRTLLVIATALCCLITVLAESNCCKEAMVVKYLVPGKPCEVVGGENSHYGCIIKICANGKAMKKTENFCGKGPCNSNGCECKGGCHVGHWETTFLQNNERYNIIITDMDYRSLFFISGLWDHYMPMMFK